MKNFKHYWWLEFLLIFRCLSFDWGSLHENTTFFFRRCHLSCPVCHCLCRLFSLTFLLPTNRPWREKLQMRYVITKPYNYTIASPNTTFKCSLLECKHKFVYKQLSKQVLWIKSLAKPSSTHLSNMWAVFLNSLNHHIWEQDLILSDSLSSAVTRTTVNKWDKRGIRQSEVCVCVCFNLFSSFMYLCQCIITYVCACALKGAECSAFPSQAWDLLQITTYTQNCRMQKPQPTDHMESRERGRGEKKTRNTNHYCTSV